MVLELKQVNNGFLHRLARFGKALKVVPGSFTQGGEGSDIPILPQLLVELFYLLLKLAAT